MIIAVTTKPKRRRPGIISFTPVPRTTGSRKIQFSCDIRLVCKFGYHCNQPAGQSHPE